MSRARPPRTRTEAQRRADRIRAFQAELAEAQEDGALDLTPEQRARLGAYYETLLADLARGFDVDTSPTQKKVSLGIQLATLVGGLSLAAALGLFFLRIWGYLDMGPQVVTVVAAPLVALAGVEAAARLEPLRFATGLLAVIAFACFVIDVQVLGQLFALAPTPEALLAYGVFAVALAYGYDHRLLLVAGASCLAAWVACSLVRLSGAWWMSALERPESLVAAGAVVLAWAQARHPARDRFPPYLRALGLFLVFGVVLVMSRVGGLSWIPAHAGAVETTYQVIGFPATAAAITIGIRRTWPEVTAVGAGFFLVFLLVKFVDWWWDWMPKYLFFLLLGLVALGLLWAFRRLRARLAVP
jgi:hypothetical protein